MARPRSVVAVVMPWAFITHGPAARSGLHSNGRMSRKAPCLVNAGLLTAWQTWSSAFPVYNSRVNLDRPPTSSPPSPLVHVHLCLSSCLSRTAPPSMTKGSPQQAGRFVAGNCPPYQLQFQAKCRSIRSKPIHRDLPIYRTDLPAAPLPSDQDPEPKRLHQCERFNLHSSVST